MREIIKMIVVLSLIGTASGFTLASLKEATRTRIEEQVLTFVQGPALAAVLPEHENNPIADRRKMALPDGSQVTVYPALSGGKLVALGIEGHGPGYGGNVGVMVSFDPGRDVVQAIGVTTHSETPGLGTRVFQPSVTARYKDHALTGLDLKNKGGDIDAVSGATYSSTGMVMAVRKAAEAYTAIKPGALAAWPR
ncbi:RnfABCDGE type electron transport complex subunit G [Desulfovibrio sp.]